MYLYLHSLFIKLPSPGDNKGTFGSSSQVATAQLSTIHGGGLTLSLLLVKVKQITC